MKLSMSIIKNSIEPYIKFGHISNDELQLDSYELYVAGSDDLDTSNLYIFKAAEFLNPQYLPNNLNILCCGIPGDFKMENYLYLNILVVSNISIEMILNITISTFKKYNNLSEKFNKLVYKDVNFQKLIDLATEILEMPLCMLDLNHNVLAISSKMDAPDDLIWQAMKEGYGYEHYDLVSISEPKIKDIIKLDPPTIEIPSNISGHYLKVSALLNGRHAVAMIGMHKKNDFYNPFEKHTIQLFNYIVEHINENINAFYDKKPDRGFFYEQFLLDTISGELSDRNAINKHLLKLGFKLSSKYQMGLISFRKGMIRTDYYITIMNYIERIIKNSKCVFLESNIYIIIPLEKERYLTDEIQLKLSDFLDCNHCYLILSSVFVTFQELPNIKEIFDFIVKFVDKDKKNIYHFHEYVSIYSMDLLAKKISMDNLFHPLIQKLIDYDQEHKSNYYETFKIFIRNQSSYTITSKDLHMHRNSLKNRINRIEELLGDDYKRPEIREELIFYMRYMDEF
ncbi:CdaR family transcriptional regulator [Acetobacterium sp. KB-1]|jgi:hypothetical protein|uniref:PucR family transcriptional regulator n=1 Tax=Acetobacterium sp. KB-1 TaxID=2184575 RepID=UPI000DBEBF89|nr:helix-turn-helix domain-containing protein [Acetobacterium sp. KB-1]AWW25879.1 hypothetical protein DOZ58_04000 [Acetobacterium sp. KB-1]